MAAHSNAQPDELGSASYHAPPANAHKKYALLRQNSVYKRCENSSDESMCDG